MNIRRNFYIGETCIYHGPLPIDGDVTVIRWEPNKWKEEGYVGDFTFRSGLVPVYSTKFPSTIFWWVSPFQLKRKEQK